MAVNAPGQWPDYDSRETFAQHLERMRRFRRLHDLAGDNNPGTAGTSPTESDPAANTCRLPPSLQAAGYILKLIQERGTLLLPRNWQN